VRVGIGAIGWPGAGAPHPYSIVALQTLTAVNSGKFGKVSPDSPPFVGCHGKTVMGVRGSCRWDGLKEKRGAARPLVAPSKPLPRRKSLPE
jgi:hypothetical protein